MPHPRTRLHSVSRKRPQTINTYGRFCKVNLGWGRPRDPQRPKALPRIQTKSREIDPNEYQQWRTGISPPQSPSVSCFGLTGPLTDRTRHFIPCWRAL